MMLDILHQKPKMENDAAPMTCSIIRMKLGSKAVTPVPLKHHRLDRDCCWQQAKSLDCQAEQSIVRAPMIWPVR